MFKLNFQKRIRDFQRSRFVKDIFKLQAGSIFSRLLSVFSAIVFARVLGANDYGIYSLIFGFVSVATIFMGVEGGSVVLILLPQAYARGDRTEIKNIISYFIKVNLATSLVIGALIILIAPLLTQWWYHDYNIGSLARIVLAGAILSSFSDSLLLCLQAVRKIKHYVIVSTLNSFLAVIIPLVLVFFFGLSGIVWGNFFNNFIFFTIAIIIYGVWIKSNPLLPKYHEIVSGIFTVKIKKYFSFGFSMLVDKKIASFYSSLPLMILGAFVAPATVGYFKIAVKYIGLIGVLTKPIANLLMVQLPKSLVDGAVVFKKNFEKVSFYTPLLSIPFIIVAVIAAEFLVVTLYGSEYRPVVPLVYLLAIGPVLNGVGIGIGSAFRVLNKVKGSIIINIFILALGLPLVYYSIKYFGVVAAALVNMLWPLVSIIICFIYVEIILVKMIKKPANNL
ncbi:MAG: oligosaccharide flippase family protein [Patescibacteria group bacterium]